MEPSSHLHDTFKIYLLLDFFVMLFSLKSGLCLALDIRPFINLAIFHFLPYLPVVNFSLHLIKIVKDLLLSLFASLVKLDQVVNFMHLPICPFRASHPIQAILDIDARKCDRLVPHLKQFNNLGAMEAS